MKKFLFFLAVFALCTTTAFSQVSFGIGGVAGTKAGFDESGSKLNFGAHARILNKLSEGLGLVGGFTFYMPTKYTLSSVETKWTVMQGNADVLLFLSNTEDSQFYGLAGVTYTSLKADVAGVSMTTGEFGWEAGGGFKIGNIFMEAKYDGKLEQIVGIVGFYF